MIKSMTGYGQNLFQIGEKSVQIEIRALNSKFFDVSIKTPPSLREYESEIRNIISGTLERGKVDVYIYIENCKPANNTINQSFFKSYYNELKSLSEEVQSDITKGLFALALQHPEAFNKNYEKMDKEEWQPIAEKIKETCQAVDEFRVKEGEALAEKLVENAKEIESLLSNIQAFEEERLETVRERLQKNIANLLNDSQYDKSRFEQEMIYYIERLDITEEKVRLKNHIDYFMETINEEVSNGKKLNFLTQEMGREINTIGSKANNFSIQQIVVNMKDELEQIKEQLNNIL